MKKEESSEFVVVGIGASAGGVNALKRFFSKVKSLNCAIVIIQHLEPIGKNITLDSLQKMTDLPVDEIVQGGMISSGHVYLSSPESLISIQDESFLVQGVQEPAQKYATIDWFFDSLAKNYQQRSVGVILSGEGIDGTSGLKAISESGGLAIAQDEKSSEYPSMPHHAAEFGIVDHMVAPEEMSFLISEHVKFLYRMEKKATNDALHEEIGASIISICEILFKHTHHDFKHYKTSTLVRRIQRRMLVLQSTSVDEYVETLKSSLKERDSLFNDLLINVTSFFRDPEAFDALKNEVLVKTLVQIVPTRKYRIWVAGCSTGEEAYTMAMVVKETIEELGIKGEVQIIATDIDEEALNIARKGEYPLSIADRVSPERLEKFFSRRNGRFIVNKHLREMILFSSHNLINDPPFSQLDLISCRNVLIYLGMHLQKKLIPVFHYALRPNGYLFLGTSEALGTHKDLFSTENMKFRIAQRKPTGINLPANTFLTAMSTTYSAHFKEAPQNHDEDLLQIGQRIVLDEFAPKFAIVNEDLQLMTISSGFNEFLEPAEGSFQNNITKLVKQNLRAALRSSISEAKKHKRQIQNYSSFVQTPRGMQKIGIVVQPMPQLGGHTGLFMVVFKDQGIINEDNQHKQEMAGVNVEMVEELEKELANLRTELDKSVQDLEASNEELKSSNEELLSMNEELQSANEELEISKEEIQRSNDALMNNNVDLENLLNSTKIATIFLDDKLNIRNFTPAVTNIYDLVPHDIGRPISSFSSKALNMPPYSFPKDLKNDQVVETEVVMPDGRVYLRRKSAYLSNERKQVGLVVTFIDVTELRTTEGSFKTLANSVPQMIWMTDSKGNYLYFSEQWKEFSGLDPVTIKNLGFRDLIHPEDVEDVVKAWTEAQGNKTEFTYEYRLKDKFGKYHWHLLKARSFLDATGKPYRWFGTCTNIQQQKEQELTLKNAQNELIKNAVRFDKVAAAADLGVWYCDLPFDELIWSPIVKNHFWLSPDAHVTIDTFYEMIHPDDREPTRIAIETSIVNNSHYDVNYRTVKKDTDEFKWIRAIGWTDYDREGKPIRFDGITLDVTETVKLLENFHQSETRYEMARKATRELIWDWDFKTNKVLWNEALCKELGYESEAMNSDATWWYEHIHPEDRERVVHGIHEIIDDKKHFWSDEYRFQKIDGSYAHFLDQGYIHIGENGEADRMIGSMMDITERTLHLKQIHEAVNARDEFLSIASHELKTPLTSIILKIQMLQRQMEKGINVTDNIEKTNALVLKQCRLLTSLIDDMLDVSRIATGRMKYTLEKTNVHDVVSHALEVFGVNLEQRSVSVVTDLEKDLMIEGDPFRLEQVVYNLLTNALKYGLGNSIGVNVFREGKEVVIKVTDHGMGISDDDMKRIFHRFERAAPAHKISGLGLGLYISKEIIDAHGGTIDVKSELGKGSVFTVRLALVK